MANHPGETKENSIITVDVAVMRLVCRGPRPQALDLQVAVIKRPKSPFEGYWVLPGGHLNAGESFGAAARREWSEETLADPVDLEAIGVFGSPGRDPRGRYVSFLFFGMAGPGVELFPSASARESCWHSVLEDILLGFDHERLLLQALKYWHGKMMLTSFALQWLPTGMTLDDLSHLLERLTPLLFPAAVTPMERVKPFKASLMSAKPVQFLFD